MMTTVLEYQRDGVDRIWPLHYQWTTTSNPLPRRVVRCLGRRHPATDGVDAPQWLLSGPTDQPFDFCGHVRRLCADIVARCSELEHIDIDRLLFGITQARSRRTHGLQARVTPLRFHDGRLERRRHGVKYQVQRHFVDDREILYVVTFCLPRFLDQDFDDKFITLFHEMYHISPEFNGDLRRHKGRCSFHSHSKRAYDRHMSDLARCYLAGGPNGDLHAFLRMDFAQLQHRHGSVVGIVVPRPKVIPMPAEEELVAIDLRMCDSSLQAAPS
jgi:hypothetical protein